MPTCSEPRARGKADAGDHPRQRANTLRAGKAAGMRTVGVLTGFDDYSALKNETPDAIIDSIAQLSETLVIRPGL